MYDGISLKKSLQHFAAQNWPEIIPSAGQLF